MLFNSREFVIFFVIVWVAYLCLRSRLRLQNGLLLVASYFFYGWWDVRFLYLLVISTVVDYTVGLLLQRGRLSTRQRWTVSLYALAACLLLVVVQWDAVQLVPSGRWLPGISVNWPHLWQSTYGWWAMAGTVAAIAFAPLAAVVIRRFGRTEQRRCFLGISLLANLGILGFFKYFNFFAENLVHFCEWTCGVTPSAFTLTIVLPVGISFYTFQTMSYTIDVYRGDLEATDNFLDFAAYVAFFPQLVAGPIERAAHLLPQVQRHRPALTYEACREGAWLITWGLYKKLVVADNLAWTVDRVFEQFDQLGNGTIAPAAPDDGLTVWIGVVAFAFQIYCDFSGYTDIARGTAKWLGFDVMLNFNLPYFAVTPATFWRRWHISLSTWLRDYLYISLGGNRGGVILTYRNLMLTMLLGGLWHGARWNFILWGGYHGLLLCAYRALGIRGEGGGRLRWLKLFGMWLVMTFFTLIGWLLFRAQNLTTIGAFLQSMFLSPLSSERTWEYGSLLVRYTWFLIAVQIIQGLTGNLNFVQKLPWFLRLNVWIFILMSLLALTTGTVQEFIYFDF